MKKEFYFVLCMAGMMSFAMCFFNVAVVGGLSDNFIKIFFYRWTYEYICAVLLVFFVVRHFMRWVSLHIGIKNMELNSTLILPSINVLIMAPVMSLIAVSHVFGFSENFLSIYQNALIRNYPAAWILQVSIIGPLVRFIFQNQRQTKLTTKS